jgi:hypothetical protein
VIEAGGEQQQAAALRQHPPAGGLRGEEGAGEVHLDGAAPFFLGQLDGRLVGGDAGIGMRHIHPAPGAVHGGESSLQLGGRGDAAAHQQPVARRIRHLAEIEDADTRAARVEGIGHRAADTLRAAGD